MAIRDDKEKFNLMPSLTLDILKRTFKVGIVVLDGNYDILCVNKTITELFGIDLESKGKFYNLSQLHSPQAFARIQKMTAEAVERNRSGSYVIKVYKSEDNKEIIFLGKVFLLHGQCQATFVALLYDVTSLLTNEEDFIVKFPVYEGDDFLLLEVDSIDFFAARGNYTEVVSQKRKFLSPLALGEIENKLSPEQFVRIHKSFIININSVQKLKKTENRYRILMKDGSDLPLSRSKINTFLKLFGLR